MGSETYVMTYGVRPLTERGSNSSPPGEHEEVILKQLVESTKRTYSAGEWRREVCVERTGVCSEEGWDLVEQTPRMPHEEL